MLVVSLIFQLSQCTPVFLSLSLCPVPHTAALWDKNFVREDGLDLLDCMYFACNELEIFAPPLVSHFPLHYPVLFHFLRFDFSLASILLLSSVLSVLLLPRFYYSHALIQEGFPVLLLYIPKQGTFASPCVL